MENENSVESVNINERWLQNIYENLKNLEDMERRARSGCNDLLEYVQIPQNQRDIITGDVQYKNICFIVTEMELLLTDLIPVVEKDEHSGFMEIIKKIQPVISNRELFIEECYSELEQKITSCKVRPFFWKTLDFLSELRRKIIKEIAKILYIKTDDKKKGW